MSVGFSRTSKHRHGLKQYNSPGGARHFTPWVLSCLGTGHSLSLGLVPSRQRGAPVCTLPAGHIQTVKATQAPPPLPHCGVLCALVTALPNLCWAQAELGAVRACCSQQDSDQGCPPGPVVPFISPYSVSSVLPMVLIHSHLLIFILPLYFRYYFVGEVHLSWGFSRFLFLRCRVSSCSFNDGVVWQDGS